MLYHLPFPLLPNTTFCFPLKIYSQAIAEKTNKTRNMADIAQRKKKLAMALIGLDELIKKCQIGEPLWLTRPDGSTTVLNEDEYVRRFPVGIFDPRPSRYMSEGSRATSVILACPPNIIQILMNVVSWSWSDQQFLSFLLDDYGDCIHLYMCVRGGVCLFSVYRIDGRLYFLGLRLRLWLGKS